MKQRLNKQQRLEIEERKNGKLLKMVEQERARVAGYEELAKLQVAYIAHLLQKLGATKDNPVTITNNDVTEALKAEVRGAHLSEGFQIYIAD